MIQAKKKLYFSFSLSLPCLFLENCHSSPLISLKTHKTKPTQALLLFTLRFLYHFFCFFFIQFLVIIYFFFTFFIYPLIILLPHVSLSHLTQNQVNLFFLLEPSRSLSPLEACPWCLLPRLKHVWVPDFCRWVRHSKTGKRERFHNLFEILHQPP